MKKCISISLVSHGQFSLAEQLLKDLNAHCLHEEIEVILTINTDEAVSLPTLNYGFPIRVVRNPRPKGFGANHNSAFKLAEGDVFCVINPDIRLNLDPFRTLLDFTHQTDIGVVAPLVLNPSGEREDSARCFPTCWELVCKLFGARSVFCPDISGVFFPDWVAGMFMLFPSHVFKKMNGFDERYFLYYEDVDLCARLALAGYKRLVCSDVTVMHDARRSSHRDLRYASMHFRSMLRFFSSDVCRRIQRLQRS